MSAAPHPDDVHEWISFEDPNEDRTWVFDATFLLSNWACIYGQGCKGVLTEDASHMSQGCCSYGAHFVDDDDVATVVASAARLTSAQWQNKRKAARGGFLAYDEDEHTTTTRLVADVCIFHNAPDFAGGAGCALHLAALAAGERPIDWKPDVCWQLPLRLHEETDAHGHVTSTLREWKRRDWGEGGREFHWWCTETSEAFVGARPTYVYLRDEITEFVGAEVYQMLATLLARRVTAPTPLPHPARRR